MGWDGMGWDGMGWDGMGWDDIFVFGEIDGGLLAYRLCVLSCSCGIFAFAHYWRLWLVRSVATGSFCGTSPLPVVLDARLCPVRRLRSICASTARACVTQ